MNILDKVIVRNKRVSPRVRPGNYQGGGSRNRALRGDADAYARITCTRIAQLVGNRRGLRWSRAELRRIAKNKKKRTEYYLNLSRDSRRVLACHGNSSFPLSRESRTTLCQIE